ncbi:uncharacterized protein LOC117178828 isoform X2 [Belonocnema kinseyi]|nr:uncharacterized protein LOC117178828 isoform X2 [Belonocnema kinseyi]
MRNPPACIQYWVDTGKPPCKAYADENYNSDSGSSLSECEVSAPLPAPSPPMKYTLPHPPQPANIPHENIQVPSVISSSSVNTREYILSATQFTAKKANLATMESLMNSRKVPDLVNIEDTYVDVCGTDELPRIAEEANQISDPGCIISKNIKGANFLSNCELNELERPLILGEMFNKNLADEILRVSTGSLKIGDVIPSLQRIRDGPENYNVDDLYADKIPSEKSEDLIESGKNMSPPATPPPKIVKQPPTRDLNRRKLFTNTSSPIELMKSSRQGGFFGSRRFSSNTNLHPALAEFNVVQNQSEATTLRRKKSLFRRKKLLKIAEAGKEKVREDENEEVREIREVRLRRRAVLELERASKSLIWRHTQPGSGKRKSKRVSFKAASKKVRRAKATKIASIKAAVDDDFLNKNDLKLRDLVVSLERLPAAVLEKLLQKNQLEASTKETSAEEPADVSKRNFNGFNSADIDESLAKSEQKVNSLVESDEDEDETQNRNLSKRSSSLKKSFTKQIISLSSDEEDIFKVAEIPKLKLGNQDSGDEELKENLYANGAEIGEKNSSVLKNQEHNSLESKVLSPKLKNKKPNSPPKSSKKNENSEAQTSHLKLDSKPEIPRKSMKIVFTLSSDEDDDFTKIIEKSFALTKSDKKKLSKTCNDLKQSKKIPSNQVRSSCGPFSGQKTDEIFVKPQFDSRRKKVNDVKLNNLSARFETDTLKVGDNNLKDDNDENEMTNKDRNQSANSSPFENMDTRRVSRLVLVSSGDSSDSDNNATLLRKKKKRKFSSKRESTNSRRSWKNNLLGSTKVASKKPALETLEEEHSDARDNSQKLIKNRLRPSIKSEKKKSVFFEKDSNSDSVCELFDNLPKPQVSCETKQESKDKSPSKVKNSLKKLRNNFPKSNLQIRKEMAKSLKSFSTFNNKRKRPGFGGSISSDSEDSQSDLEFTERPRVKKIGTFENSENVIRTLHPEKRIRKKVEEASYDCSMNIFGDDQSRDSSLNIFGSSRDSSDDESILHLNFKNRCENLKGNQKFVKNVGPGIKLQTFRTKSYWESDSD